MFLYDHELELVTHREPKREPCYYCGIDCCPGQCGPEIEAQLAAERRERQQAELQEELIRIAQRRKEVLTERRDNLLRMAAIEQQIAEREAEYAANIERIERARDVELADALARSGAPGLEAAAAAVPPDAVPIEGSLAIASS